ncbi:MAG TPA: hypothetical protein VG838_00775 [Opitutaceae bacterium]|nr:hypothetical protein [Opitutaceae bacterium]
MRRQTAPEAFGAAVPVIFDLSEGFAQGRGGAEAGEGKLNIGRALPSPIFASLRLCAKSSLRGIFAPRQKLLIVAS